MSVLRAALAARVGIGEVDVCQSAMYALCLRDSPFTRSYGGGPGPVPAGDSKSVKNASGGLYGC
jgi:hypothetical protein